MAETPSPYFLRYIKLVPETDLLGAMQTQLGELDSFFREIPQDQLGRTHPPYTWKVRQVIIHIIDSERIFAYRALRFARADQTPLPGFEENDFANRTLDDARSAVELADDFRAIRSSNLLMFRSFSKEAWNRRGLANHLEWGVTDIARAIVGHARHHAEILKVRVGWS